MLNAAYNLHDLTRRVHDRFTELAKDLPAFSAMVGASPSALAGHVLLRWRGINGAEREVRIYAFGSDLDQVLTEFADRCRAAS